MKFLDDIFKPRFKEGERAPAKKTPESLTFSANEKDYTDKALKRIDALHEEAGVLSDDEKKRVIALLRGSEAAYTGLDPSKIRKAVVEVTGRPLRTAQEIFESKKAETPHQEEVDSSRAA